jgi:hypothetical protein
MCLLAADKSLQIWWLPDPVLVPAAGQSAGDWQHTQSLAARAKELNYPIQKIQQKRITSV